MKSPIPLFLFCLGLWTGAASCPAAPFQKLPLPDDPTQQKALAQIKEVYSADMALAKQPEQQAALAQKMLQAALPEQGDPNMRYTLLTLAKTTAEAGGDLDTAIAAIDAMDKTYQIDSLAQKADAAVAVAKMTHAPTDIKNLVERLDDMIVQDIHADRYDLAAELSAASVAAARNVSDPALIRLASFHIPQIKDAQAAYADVKDALATLRAKPLDSDANFKVGRFLCFYKGDWDNGIPMLALGNDPPLRDLAQREFEGPVDQDATVALGDDWWALSENQIGTAKAQLQSHAAHWYQQALAESTGVTRGKLEGRLAMVDALNAAGRKLVDVPLVDSEEKFRAAWRDTGSGRFEKKNRTIQIDSRGDLGEIVSGMPWISISLEVCCTDYNPNGLAVRINGTSLSLRGLADAAKGQFIPVAIACNKAKNVISLTVENHLLDSASVVQDDFDKKLVIGFFWPGQVGHFQIRNVIVTTDSPPETPVAAPPPKPADDKGAPPSMMNGE